MQGDFGDEEIAPAAKFNLGSEPQGRRGPRCDRAAPAHYHLVSELGEERDLETVAQVLGDRIPEVKAFAVVLISWSTPKKRVEKALAPDGKPTT